VISIAALGIFLKIAPYLLNDFTVLMKPVRRIEGMVWATRYYWQEGINA
jgi:hypothetical protein